MVSMAVHVEEIEIADTVDTWRQAGFTVDADDVCRVGGVRLRLVGREAR